MRIGLDFDNTIVRYDELFFRVAHERNLLPEGIGASKLAVRDYLRKSGQEDCWTELQGYVYGARMQEATAYEGAIEFIRDAKAVGHTLAIISHKSRYPFKGDQYDLHAAARSWIERRLADSAGPLIPGGNIFFELTKEEKLRRIASFACDIYIDDLPEILVAEEFPSRSRRFLFDPDVHHGREVAPGVKLVRSWLEFSQQIQQV